MSKTYLGDSVYADTDSGMIKLTTENGVEVTNTIFLEPEVYNSLVAWVEYGKKASGLQGVTAKNGLLYRDGVELDTMAADKLARANGYEYAEQLVKALTI
jgi:hypothetical protein